MVADNCVTRSGGSSASLFSFFRGTPPCIPFDETNTKTWKFATESALEVIEALEIARGNEFVIPVPNGITGEEQKKVGTVQESYSKIQNWFQFVGSVNGYKCGVSKRYQCQLQNW